MADRLRAHGMTEDELMRIFRTFNAGAEPFRVESLAHEQALAGATTGAPSGTAARGEVAR
jgi:hypothetical protein